MPEAPRDDVLLRLRSVTGAAHARLEAELDLLGRGLDPDRYRRLLERFLGFHRIVEPRLDAWHRAADLLDWPDRRKTALLVADLGDLGVGPGRLAALPDCPDVPEITSTADALGILYVVEGATLGGRVIAEHLRGGCVPVRALRFFGSYGEDVGRRWNGWRTTTRGWVGEDGVRADGVVAAAAETFAVLGRWLAPAAKAAA